MPDTSCNGIITVYVPSAFLLILMLEVFIVGALVSVVGTTGGVGVPRV